MGMKSKPRLREEQKETKGARLEKEASPEEKEEKIIVKKWKGKEWFNIMSPAYLGAKLIGQTPTTDPKGVVGRNIDVSIAELTGDNRKRHMKVMLRINKIEGKTCLTSFNGLECVREHLMRMVRKRNQKVETIFNTGTKDGWFLKIKFLTILNGNTTSTLQTKMREFVSRKLTDFTKNSNLQDFLRKVISTEVQMKIKKEGSKIYPVRFSEVARIRVLRSPEFKAEAPKPPKKEEKKEAKAEEKVKKKKEAEKKPVKKEEEIKPEKAPKRPGKENTDKKKKEKLGSKKRETKPKKKPEKKRKPKKKSGNK